MVSTTALRRAPEPSGIPEVPSGSKTSSSSPPLDLFINPNTESSWSDANTSELKGEAAQTIPGECERLFCDKLSTIFLGERRFSRQESLGMGAYLSRPNYNHGQENKHVQKWIEVLDYTSDCIYRGFVTDMNNERVLFIFFGDNALGHDLKTGLIALFELASMPAFGCCQIVACIPRSQDATELEVVRNLGWCGFSLTTLQPWNIEDRLRSPLSTEWLFLSAEV